MIHGLKVASGATERTSALRHKKQSEGLKVP